MPILRSPVEVAERIGITVGGKAPVAAEPKFRAMLENATTRVENMLSTPLGRANRVDHFELDPRFLGNTEVFRLSAGFVDPASVIVTDPYGDVVNSDRYRTASDLGVVTVSRPRHGCWQVAYTSGFLDDGSDPAVYQGTPGWMQEIVDTVSLAWVRMVMADKIPDSVSYTSLMNAIWRDIASRVYGRYDRPRSPAHFPTHSEQVQ